MQCIITTRHAMQLNPLSRIKVKGNSQGPKKRLALKAQEIKKAASSLKMRKMNRLPEFESSFRRDGTPVLHFGMRVNGPLKGNLQGKAEDNFGRTGLLTTSGVTTSVNQNPLTTSHPPHWGKIRKMDREPEFEVSCQLNGRPALHFGMRDSGLHHSCGTVSGSRCPPLRGHRRRWDLFQ